jgi:hypothetical protein
MCRNIKRLRREQPPIAAEEIEACVRHFVVKLSGYRKPSQKNSVAFDKAITEIFHHSAKLLGELRVGGKKSCVAI